MEDEQWQQICQQVKQTLTGTPQEQQDTLRRRLLRFFGNNSLEQSRFYVPRRQLVRNPLLVFQPNSLIVYGVDFLSSRRLEHYMAPSSPEIVFLDDSHSALIFSDPTKLVAALYSKLLSPFADAATFQAKLSRSSSMKLEWMELQPYFEMGFQRRMWARFLTSQDLEDGEAKNRTFLETYLHAKQQFISNMQRFSQEALLPKNNGSRSRSRDSERGSSYKGSNSVKSSNVAGSSQCPCLERHFVDSLKQVRGSRRDHGSPPQRNYRPYERRPYQHHQNHKNESNIHPNDLKEQIVPNMPNFRQLPSKPSSLSQKINGHFVFQSQPQQEEQTAQQKEQRMIASLLEQLQKYKFDEDEPSFDKLVSNRSNNRINNRSINHSNSDFTIFDISERQQ